MERVNEQAQRQANLIPDFCNARAILTMGFIMEMVAVVMTLSSGGATAEVAVRFLVLSLYLQWIGLCAAAILCLTRRWLQIARAGIVFFVCWGFLQVAMLVMSDIGFHTAQLVGLGDALPSDSRRAFILRSVMISGIVSLLVLRYFWARNAWQSQVLLEGEARYQALHARIRPHFLFNSLNSLAELIATKPVAAEAMVEDLADLFRVSLDVRSRLAPLREELDLVRKYLRIEQTRLGAGLGAEWDVDPEVMDAQVPLLTIQPLVENAVYHGVAKIAGPGVVTIRARADGRTIVVEVENPLPPQDQPGHVGSKVAVGNIAERLRLIYGDRATLELGREEGLFRARLRLPWVKEAVEKRGQPA